MVLAELLHIAEALPGPHKISSSMWLSGLSPRSWQCSKRKHVRSAEAELLTPTQSLCGVLTTEESRTPSPGSVWRTRVTSLRQKLQNLLLQKDDRGRSEKWHFCSLPQTSIILLSKNVPLYSVEFPTPKSLHKSEHTNWVKLNFDLTRTASFSF